MQNSISDAIRSARHHRGLSQERLASNAGVSERAVSYWETERRDPTASSLCKLAGALGVEFVCRNEGMHWREV